MLSLLSSSSTLPSPPSRDIPIAASASHRKTPKNLRYPRRTKLPPDPSSPKPIPSKTQENVVGPNPNQSDDSAWTDHEIEVISALFSQGPPKCGPNPRLRPPRVPAPRKPQPTEKAAAAAAETPPPRRTSVSRDFKSPDVLVAVAREIGALPSDSDAAEVLDKCTTFLRKGSLSLTVRELGHMGLPDRAAETLRWAQKKTPNLFPDDRVLSSTVEVLARTGRLRMDRVDNDLLNSASRSVMEAMARGFIGAGNVRSARRVLLFAKDNRRTLDAGIHAKLALEALKNPDRRRLVEVLLDELGEREDFDLKPQDCTAVMKACVKLARFDAVERIFDWFKASGRRPTVVMYTAVVHSRFSAGKYREGMGAVWEMEERNVLLDLPAYRVVIRLCVALDDLGRAVKYFARLKDAGFAPTYDVYRDVIRAYAAEGRLAKCREVCKEVEMAGMKLDNGIVSLLSSAFGTRW